jgi:hypothetical protein
MTARPKSTPVTPATDQHGCTGPEIGTDYPCSLGLPGNLATSSLDDLRSVSYLRAEYTDGFEVIVMVFAIAAFNAALKHHFLDCPHRREI